jgi:asparagine synthase (glutamine-hydrolysing)
MTARSPHRGEISMYEADGIAMAVQSLGWDASVARGEETVVAFHGFVGNWDELRNSHGLRFDTGETDAEIIAAAFEEMKEEIIPLLRGEFAVFIHDLRRSRTLAARDVVGCRPLYLQENGNYTVVATEIRQVVAGIGHSPKPNERAVVAHLVNLPQIGDDTLVSDVRCVMPGDVYSFSWCGDRVALGRRPYWCLEDAESANRPAEDEWLPELAYRLERSVRRWLPSHPSALTLSGGLDSSAIWAQLAGLADQGFKPAEMVRPVSLFFPGFECDERDYVERILGATGHRVLGIDGTAESLTSLRPELLECLDTIPFRTTYFLYLIAQAAATDGRSTVMTGFLGDHWFDICPQSSRGHVGRGVRLILQQVLGGRLASRTYPRLRGLTKRKDPNSGFSWLGKRWRGFVEEHRWEGAVNANSSRAIVSHRLDYERTGWSLQSWEQIGAAFGVEFRHPFADPDLIGLAANVPGSLCDQRKTKLALRRILVSKLPAEIVQRWDKTVFDCLVQRCEPSLASELPPGEWYLINHGIVDRSALDRLQTAANTHRGEALRTVLWLEEVEAFVQSLVKKG